MSNASTVDATSVTKPSRRIFVYGSLRRDEYNHARVQGWGLGELRHICDGLIRGAKLYNLGSYPGIVPSDSTDDVVWGEVYEVPDSLFFRIDGMEVGAGYKRQPVKVEIPDDGQDTEEADAYFYLYGEELGSNQLVPGGDWSKRSK